MACHAQRRADGSYTCDNCKTSWDADDIAPCDQARADELAERAVKIEVPNQELVIGYDPGKPGGDLSAISWPPGHPPTLMQFAEVAGWTLEPYQKQLVKMLDEQLAKRPLASFMSKRRGNT